jgi:hypothetical protein
MPSFQAVRAQRPEEGGLRSIASGEVPDGKHAHHHTGSTISLFQATRIKVHAGGPIQRSPKRAIGQGTAARWCQGRACPQRVDYEVKRTGCCSALQQELTPTCAHEFTADYGAAGPDRDAFSNHGLVQQRE